MMKRSWTKAATAVSFIIALSLCSDCRLTSNLLIVWSRNLPGYETFDQDSVPISLQLSKLLNEGSVRRDLDFVCPFNNSEMELEFLPCHKSFKSNPLLVHPAVGRARRPTSKLPPETFVYGSKSDFKDNLDAGESRHVANPLAKPGLDFVRLNISSVDEGALTSQQVAQYRKSHEIRLRQGLRQAISRDMPAHFKDITFGKEAKPAEREDFRSIITNQAHAAWIQGQRKRAQERNKLIRNRLTGTGVAPRSTRADELRLAQRQSKEALMKHKSESSLWKMERFRHIQPRLPVACSQSPHCSAVFNATKES